MMLLAAHDNVFKTGTKWLNLKFHLNYVSRHSVKKNTQKKQKQKTKKKQDTQKIVKNHSYCYRDRLLSSVCYI